jgi:glycosyltransferase involved in cell wall biosynthesis
MLCEAECGITVKCGDGAALANAIQALRSDAGLRESMGLRARDVFDRRFTLDIAEAKWLGRVLSPEYISPASALRPRQIP